MVKPMDYIQKYGIFINSVLNYASMPQTMKTTTTIVYDSSF